MSILLTTGILQQALNLQAVGADVTPDPLDWEDQSAIFAASTNLQVITGISSPITLRIQPDSFNGLGDFACIVNAVEYNMTNDFINNGYSDITVYNNDEISFYRESPYSNEYYTVKNLTDGESVLDYFLIYLEPAP